MTAPWIPMANTLPPEGVLVETKIHDNYGLRNTQKLKRYRNLYFMSDGIYVYYHPTHWRNLEDES